MWFGQFIVAPFGRRIGVRAKTPELLRAARARLLPGWVEEEGDEVDYQWSLSEDSATYEDTIYPGNPERIFDAYFHLFVGETARDRTFIHAGVVVADNRAILLPGRSHSGKSTLTRALLEKGAAFYSDDLAVVDPSGMVYAYPKPLCIRRAAGAVEEVPAPGWSPDLPPVPVSLIAGLQYVASTPEVPWEELSPGQAALFLLDNCLGCRREPARDIATIGILSTQARAYQGFRGEAEITAGRLLKLLARREVP